MPINYQGTKVTIPEHKIPTGILRESITPFYDQDYNSYQWTFEIDKATVHNADPKTTFDTLLVFLSTAIESKLINDFVSTNLVDAYGNLFDVQSNLDTDKDPNNSDAYKNVVPSYICKVNVKVKIS